MSRCFPFPPPGYERKHILEDLILFKEAKHKEKKEKKEKRDKDRKKDKEKKDKDRKKDEEKKEKDGSEKQRDKKDRKGKHKDKKEKHGDKKKGKDARGKDKEKSRIFEESTVAGKHEGRSGEKVHPEVQNKYSGIEDEGKCSTVFQDQNGKKPLQSILPSQATKEAIFVQELDRRIRDDEKGRGSQFPQRVADVGKGDQEATAGTAIWNPSQVLAEEKHNDGDKSFQGKKLESQGRNCEFIGKASVQNLTHVAKSKNEGIPRPSEEHNDSRLEDNETYEETNKQGDKRKDRDKKSRGKDKPKEKEKKEEKKKKKRGEKANVNIENEKSEPEKSKISGRNDLTGAACNNRSVNVVKDVIGTALNEGSIRKRKDMDTNGFLHESEIRPNKVQMLALHQSTENGRKLEASSKSSSDRHAVPNNVLLGHHGQLNNGIIESKKPSPSKPNPSGINKFSDQIVVPPKTPNPDFSSGNDALRMPKKKDHSTEASKRPPHPDSKYLSQILTVPTVGDWSEDVDEEWLFSKKGPPNKPESEPVGVSEELQCCPLGVAEESALSSVTSSASGSCIWPGTKARHRRGMSIGMSELQYSETPKSRFDEVEDCYRLMDTLIYFCSIGVTRWGWGNPSIVIKCSSSLMSPQF